MNFKESQEVEKSFRRRQYPVSRSWRRDMHRVTLSDIANTCGQEAVTSVAAL